MKYGYIGNINSAKEFQEYLLLFKQRGVHLENVTLNLTFDEFVASLSKGDTVVVYSYIGVFVSLGSYLTTAIELLDRGVVIESLLEPNIRVDGSNSDIIRELNVLTRKLRSISSLKSLNKLKKEGKQLGRPRGSCSSETPKKIARVEKLRKESNISIVDACRLTGCNPRTYYRLKDKKSNSSKNIRNI